jgi:radical SAM superfamily enzyme YgiQ (UPF0313 family)
VRRTGTLSSPAMDRLCLKDGGPTVTWQAIAEARRQLEREKGTVVKDWGGRLAVALVYPNTYFVGMSSLGVQTLYYLLNQRRDVVCERAFWSPPARRRAAVQPISLESQRPLVDFALLAMSLSFELDYFHAVRILQDSGIPPLARQRDESWPLVIAGGPAITANPEPMAPIFDAIVIGEAELLLDRLVDTVQGTMADKASALQALAQIPGVYIPTLLHSDGVQRRVSRQWVPDLSPFPTHSAVLTPDTEFGDLYLMEIARGCRRGCRFCLAGHVYRPEREHPLASLLEQARHGLQFRDRIGLVSAAVSDHSRIDELVTGLRDMGARISVASLRADSLTEPLVRALAESGTETLTLAPEAGCERLRRVIGKTQSEEALQKAIGWADTYRLGQLKLYFMIGHPTETSADLGSLVEWVAAARRRFARRITINLTPFVPKAHTPFQWAGMMPVEALRERQDYVQQRLRGLGVVVRADHPAWAEVQGVLARGDHRLADVLVSMENPSLAAWRAALSGRGLQAEEFLTERHVDATLPWDVVDMGSSTSQLMRSWQVSQGMVPEQGRQSTETIASVTAPGDMASGCPPAERVGTDE